MSDKKSTLTLSDLLSRDGPDDGSNQGSPTLTSPLGGREDIEKRTRFMREKVQTEQVPVEETNSPVTEPESSDLPTDSLNIIVKPTKQPPKKAAKTVSKADDDKVTRSIQFSRATYRQMETTLNYIAYKSGKRNVSFPKYFELLHDMARQNPELMNQLIAHFKTTNAD